MWIMQSKNGMDTLLMTKEPVIGKLAELIQIQKVTKMMKNYHQFTI
jgi:hypothetical protein